MVTSSFIVKGIQDKVKATKEIYIIICTVDKSYNINMWQQQLT